MMRAEHIRCGFDKLPVLEDVSFQVADDEIVALIGPSGCGKSTILNVIAGLKKADEGTLSGNGGATAFVFQDDRLLPWRSVWKNISLVRDKEDKDAIARLIRDVGLEGFEHYLPGQLSGGMKKRCGIARAFYRNSDLLLMDEPFQGLDYPLRQEMLQMLLSVWREHKQGVLFVTHEIEEAFTVAGRVLVLSRRPSRIIREIVLPPYEKRRADHPELLRARQEILSLIM